MALRSRWGSVGRDALRRSRYQWQLRFGPRDWRHPPWQGSPRLLVIGICQGVAIGRAMRLLLPAAEIEVIDVADLGRRFRSTAELVAEASRYDVVFANRFAPFAPDGDYETLRAGCRLVPIPTIVFLAYHPDAIQVGDFAAPGGRGIVYGPMGGEHSALALFSYLEGLPVEAALRLYTEAVYERLGYLDLWHASVESILELGRHAQYDLSAEILRWSRRGCFMHTINHPRPIVTADLARGLLAKAGIAFPELDLEAILPDDLLPAGSWPVYPPVAARYGLPGSMMFLKGETAITGPYRTMTLETVLRASYAYFARRPTRELRSDRVASWRADPDIVRFLRESAGV
ncbi:MAG: hypothetical protein JO048_16000 [Methylobacteriaceae bacterium]|nr:hypothetical protein [Methylobacteriaceae bacterium]